MRDRIKRSSDVLKDRRKRFFVKTLWVFLVFIILVIGLGFVSHIEGLLVKDVKVSGNEVLEESELKEETLEILSENILFIFARDNKFLLNKSYISKKLKDAFPRILDISIERSGDIILLDIVERERAYLWCGEGAPIYADRFSERDCYFLDTSGFIFDIAPKFSTGVYFTFYNKLNGDDPLSQYILDFDFMKDIFSLVKALDEKNLPVHSLVVKEGGQYELLFDINTITGDYAKLLFASDQNLSDVYNKINSVVDEDPLKTDLVEKRSRLEYIDTRFKNRIFYRFAE